MDLDTTSGSRCRPLGRASCGGPETSSARFRPRRRRVPARSRRDPFHTCQPLLSFLGRRGAVPEAFGPRVPPALLTAPRLRRAMSYALPAGLCGGRSTTPSSGSVVLQFTDRVKCVVRSPTHAQAPGVPGVRTLRMRGRGPRRKPQSLRADRETNFTLLLPADVGRATTSKRRRGRGHIRLRTARSKTGRSLACTRRRRAPAGPGWVGPGPRAAGSN